jgi:hypothetical protein
MQLDKIAISHSDTHSSLSEVVVHVLERSLEREPVAPREALQQDGPHVTAGTSRRIGCDSSMVCVKEDENGEPLSIGRRSRTIPPPMRRALGIRDGGCRFPGCTNTRFVDGHHIKHWADGNVPLPVYGCPRHQIANGS